MPVYLSNSKTPSCIKCLRLLLNNTESTVLDDLWTPLGCTLQLLDIIQTRPNCSVIKS